jgi:hypothetical protein
MSAEREPKLSRGSYVYDKTKQKNHEIKEIMRIYFIETPLGIVLEMFASV